METAKKQNREAEETKNKGADEVRVLNDEMTKLKAHIKNLESKHAAKEKDIKSAEANSVALKNQSEGFLLEYDRLQAENQNHRNQLRSIDESVSHSNGKKNTAGGCVRASALWFVLFVVALKLVQKDDQSH
ncbi:uncharacterized protein [Rutidosis leptorrhynchoides]|uniref:uncharacterized protein n=1 Tax=Rutidosis leptorrhynchoides TaxID=125765 RepID=UPI003A990A0D